MRTYSVALVVLLAVLGSAGCRERGTISPENYSKVQVGMSFDEVKRIIGDPTRTVSEVDFAGTIAGTYAWDTKEAIYVIAIENGKVRTKMPPQSPGSSNLGK